MQKPQEGESGAEARYRYTNKKSKRSPYIAERAKLAHNLTEREILQLQYQNREGATVPYQKSDLRYDTQQGYLQITGGSQPEGGRAQPERRTGCHRPIIVRYTAKSRGEVCLFVCLFGSRCSGSLWWTSPYQGWTLRYP